MTQVTLYRKGYESSCEHDEDISDKVELSNDENEVDYKVEISLVNRGDYSRENI